MNATNNSSQRSKSLLNVSLIAATILLFLPTWLWLGDAWLSDPYYSHGPLVLVVALYFTWARRAVLTTQPTAPNNLGIVVIAGTLAVHLWAMLWRAYYISALMIPLTLLGLGVTLYGWQITRRFLFPIAFLVLMVPLPIAERFGPMLEGWTVASATWLAQAVGVAAQNAGSQVSLPNSTFTVGIPCGGLRSVIAIITLATLWAYIVKGAWWARALVFLAAIPIALAANTLRITLLFAIASVWGAQVGLDYFHSWSSPVLFLSAFLLLLGFARVVRCSEVRWEVVFPQ
jgi:exosortase